MANKVLMLDKALVIKAMRERLAKNRVEILKQAAEGRARDIANHKRHIAEAETSHKRRIASFAGEQAERRKALAELQAMKIDVDAWGMGQLREIERAIKILEMAAESMIPADSPLVRNYI